MINEILTEITNYFNNICMANSTATRNKYGKMIIQLLEEYPETQKHWLYLPDEFNWCNRFRFIEIEDYYIEEKEIPVFNDPTNLKPIPEASGLYFFGNTVFDPFTRKEYYWVKIGLSTNMKQRGKGYDTHNPAFYPIDFKAIPEHTLACEESKYQNLLKREVLFKHKNNKEWFLVSRETYLEMSEKGFDYFSQTP